jgi:hypothetical protein
VPNAKTPATYSVQRARGAGIAGMIRSAGTRDLPRRKRRQNMSLARLHILFIHIFGLLAVWLMARG